ncbi:methylation-associated defense system restriction endonuclease subunit S MAD5 [Bacteroides fragilis]|uniref:methylation-associated defense system restriction endonuclease subunit S MAD5 n=3 Tax=Bacteroides fragilis TaxID=817 RepID=UPI0032EEFC96
MKIGHIHRMSMNPCGLRFDSSYHLSDGVTVKRDIAASPYPLMLIGKAAERIFIGGRARRVYVKDRNHGIPFLSSSDILQADLENVKLASKKYTPNIEEMTLQKGWTLITRSGTIGNCAFANAKHAQKLASEDVIRLVPNNILKQGYIYAYLASKPGYSLLTQGTFGAVIQHIEPAFVASLPIPVLPEAFQQEVDNLIQESARLREEATDALDKAISYFNQEYPIKDRTSVCYTKKLKSLELGFAAYNNNIEVDGFIAKYDSNSLKIADITSSVFAPPLFKHIYLSQDNGYPFMTGSELTKFNMRYYRWLSPRGVKNIKDYVVKKGTLLLYKSGTTDGGILGNVFIADKKLDGCCLSDHVIRIVFNDDKMAYWAFAFLRSNGTIKMLQRLATGTMIPFITPERVSNMLIPAPDTCYEEIVELVSRYIDLNSKSKFLEIEAIEKVESEIASWTTNKKN